MNKEESNRLLGFYTGEFQGINLTRITDPDEFYEKQIKDSLYPFTDISELSSLAKNYSLYLDVGFGGGFPLIPLAWQFRDKKILGVDARGKKATSVQKIANSFGLDNVTTFHGRIEEVLIDKNCLITFKAVGPIKEFLEKINVQEGCDVVVVFYKGPNTQMLEDIPSECNGFKIIVSKEYELDKNSRSLYIYEKIKNVPRGTKKNKNKIIVKISQFA